MRNTQDKSIASIGAGAGDFGLPKKEPPTPPPKRVGPKLTKAQKKARKKERTQLRLADQRALEAIRIHDEEADYRYDEWD